MARMGKAMRSTAVRRGGGGGGGGGLGACPPPPQEMSENRCSEMHSGGFLHTAVAFCTV